MASLNDLVRSRTDLSDADLDGLHLLLGEWQILADLSFADLVLWLPTRHGERFVAAAQMRPTTGPTAFPDDLVGTETARSDLPTLSTAVDEGRIVRDPPVEVGLSIEAIPVRRAGRVLGVVARYTPAGRPRLAGSSELEQAYLASADELSVMVAEGRFPFPALFVDPETSPRVGDGLVRLDPAGIVTYASPNALSAYRRLGLTADLVGSHLGRLTAELAPTTGPVDEAIAVVASGRTPRMAEVGGSAAHLLLRAIPIQPGGVRRGSLVLLRDVTDLRRRDQQMATKDATIREVHHRVKNNLQTVAALLRLQARRIDIPAGRLALEEAVRRVGSIAIVHETLSHTPDELVAFDEIADRLMAMVVDVGSDAGQVTARRAGSFGVLPAEVATPLAMALTEVLQNAVEHGVGAKGGALEVSAGRQAGRLHVEVLDDGRGLPMGFDAETSGRLGLQIVRTLISGELSGTLDLTRRRGGGTRVAIDVPVGRAPSEPLL